MQQKNRLLTSLNISQKNPLTIFCICNLFVIFCISFFRLQIKFIDPELIRYTGFISLYIIFFQWLKRINREHIIYKTFIVLNYGFFIMTSLFVALLNSEIVKNIQISDGIKSSLPLVVIGSGLLIFFSTKIKDKQDENNNGKVSKIITLEQKNNFFYKKIARVKNWVNEVGVAHVTYLILITSLFLVIRVGLPFLYKASCIDEYTHIFSALELIKHGHFASIYFGAEYHRGEYLSLLLAAVFYIFGEKLIFAKLLISILGIINYFLLYLVSRS